MKSLTKLENPNSVQQLKGWLADNGLETETLGKKVVSELIETSSDDLSEVLTLRQQIAKSSIKKYQAMKNAVCSDSRTRGCSNFMVQSHRSVCRAYLQPQNLPRNQMPDLSQARELVRTNK